MKKKNKRKLLRIIAVVLTISMLVTAMPPMTSSAKEVAAAKEAAHESWSPKEIQLPNTEGDLTLEQLKTAKLVAEDTPEIVSAETIKKKGHVNRLWAQEQDLSTLVFQNRDGTKTAYHYSDPVKYKDKNGKIKDKKNKLSKTSDGDYTNPENDINAYFPKKIHKNKGIELKFGKYVIEMAPNINGSSGASRQTGHDKDNNPTEYVEYPEVFADDISLRYTPTFGGYKEDIILAKNTGINRFEFKLTTNGLSLVQASTGNYYLAEPLTGKYVTALGNVVVYDKSGRESEGYNHYYQVTTISEDEEYLITVVVDENYLESANTKYPVYVDPTLEVVPKGQVEDATLYSTSSETSYSGELKIGYSAPYSIGRALFDFPIFKFEDDFIYMYGNQIVSAELNLYATIYGSNYASYNQAKTLSLYEYNHEWSPSTVKWSNTFPNDYGALVCSTSVTTEWTKFDITSIINKFKTNSDYTTNFKGVILKADNETPSTWKKFISSYGTSSGRPYISITYNDNPPACPQVVSGATYYLKNYNGDYLDVYSSNTSDNTRLLTEEFDGDINQQFKITNVSSGEYEIAPQHSAGKVLSVNSSGQVVIEEDCNLSRQRWYIYYSKGEYHIVNKQCKNGIMAPTYDTDYVSINNKYEYCCWELEKFDGIKNISIIKFSDEYQQVLYTTTFYNGEILAFLEDKEGNRSNVVTVNEDNKNFLLNNYIWYDDFWFNGNPNGLSQPPVEYSRIHIAHEKIEAYFLHDSPLVKWSDEYYALWSIITLVESAYLYYTSLIAETVETLTVIAGLVYQTVVAIKSIGISTNQNRQVSAQAYNSTVNGINAMGQMGPDAADYSSTNNIAGLRNTGNFKSGSINHVLKGEINKSGKAVGYHYEGFSDSQGCVISGTRMSANQYGVYQAKVQVNGINKTANDGYSSFFPVTMTPQQIIDATNQAYGNRVYVQGNTYIGVANNGMEIVMYLDASNKIISFFPTY